MLNVRMDTTRLSDRGNTAPLQSRGPPAGSGSDQFAARVIAVVWAQVPGFLCDVCS